jgi:hypothetical protein
MHFLFCLLAAYVVRAAPTLVERAAGMSLPSSCTASNVVPVLNLLSSSTGGPFCDQLLDTVEATQTVTVQVTSVSVVSPSVTTTQTASRMGLQAACRL